MSEQNKKTDIAFYEIQAIPKTAANDNTMF